ncbi:MAG: hypothetical protein NVSMB19_04750 [Vulcanimicrobiaceae bacterium]
MRFSIAGPSLASGLAVLAGLPLAATAAPAGCSSDAFVVKGAALVVELCAVATTPHPGSKSPVTVTETITAKGQPALVRKVALDAALGDEISRTIDDAPLQALGIAGTLHMTLAYKSGAVHLEHALLVPGAIALK